MKNILEKRLSAIFLSLTILFVFSDHSLAQQLSLGGTILSNNGTFGFPTGAASSPALTFTLTNGGGSSITFAGNPVVQITGTNAADFVVTAQPALSALSSGQSTTFMVTYTPSGTVVETAQMSISSDDPASPFVLNLTGPGSLLYGPQYPPIGTVSQSTNNVEAGRTGGRDIYLTGVSLSTNTTTYWGPQINSQGELQLKLSLDGNTYTNKEIFAYDAASSNLSNGIAVWRGQTQIANAISGQMVTVYTRATLKTKRLDASVVPLTDPYTLGLSEQVGGLVKINDVTDYLVANYFIEASTSFGSGYQPYLDFYDAYPTPPGPLPGAGVGAAYSSISNGFYWQDLLPRLTTNQILTLDEGTSKTITTSDLYATDDEDMPNNPQSIVFEFKTATSNSSPMAYDVGTLKKDATTLTKTDVFTLKDLMDGKISYTHDGSETTYDEFQFSVHDSKGQYAKDGAFTVFSFKIQVTPVNDPPVPQDVHLQSSYAIPLNGNLVATDEEGDNLTYQLTSQPASGNVVLNSGSSFTYTPDGTLGTFSFTYKVFDGTNYSVNDGTVTIVVENLPPVANNDNITTQEGVMIQSSFSATDPESGALTFGVVNAPSHGTVDISGSSYKYTPAANYFGTDQFTYSATDPNSSSSNATISISVKPSIDPGDLLIGNQGNIVLVDAVNNLDAIIFSGGNISEVRNVIYQRGKMMYVLDANTGLIKIDPATGNQTVLTPASSFNPNPKPLGFIQDSNGDIIVADGSNGIRKVDPNTGSVTTLSSGGNLVIPAAVVQLADGNYLVSDAGFFAGQTSKLIKIAPDGTQTVISQGNNLKICVDLELVDQNTALVNDGGSLVGGTDQIIQVDLTTGQQTVISSGNLFGFPSGGAYNSLTNNFYVVNQNNNKLLSVDPTSGQQTQISIASTLNNPFGVSIVGRQEQTITFDASTLPAITYGDAPVTLPGTAALPITYSSSDANVATVSGNSLTVVGAGSVIITASQSGDNNFLPATSVQQTITINKAQLTATADNQSKIYGDTNPILTFAYSGFKGTDDATVVNTPPTASSVATTTTSVGNYAIDLTGGSDNNYTINLVSGQLTITKATVTATADDKAKIFGNANPALTISYSGFKGTDDASVIDTPPQASTSAVLTSDVGTYPITLTGGSDNNYDITLVSGQLSITKATLTATADNKTKIYGDVNPTLTITYSGFKGADDVSVIDTPPQASTTAVLTSDAGTYPITLASGSDNNYSLTLVYGTLTVNKANQSITFGSLASQNYGDAPLALGATASSGLAISYSSTNTGVATISGNTLTIVGAGSTLISASQTGNGNYNAATDVLQALTVNKATQAITFGSLATKNYGDVPFTLSATASSSLGVSYSSSNTSVATVSGNTVTIVGAGTTTIKASQIGNTNYSAAPDVPQTLTVNKANQTITYNALPSKNYGDAAFTLNATASSGLTVSYFSSNTNVAAVNGSTVTIVGVGTTTITASQTGNGNYNAAVDVPQTFTVNKANQAITFNTLASKNYGDAPFELGATASSSLAVSYSSSNINVATVSGTTVTIIGVGTTIITASQPGNANYNAATDMPQTLTVDKASQSITFNALTSKSFGDAPFSLNATTNSSLTVSYTSSNTGVATINGNTVTIVGVGTTTITASQAGSVNYNAAADVQQTLTVNKANQTITVAGIAVKTLGDAAFSLSATASSGLAVTFSTTSDKITISGSTVTLVKAGRTIITASQSGNASFNAAPNVDQSFCINPPKPSVTLSGKNTANVTLTSSNTSGNQWYLNDTAIPNATDATLAVTQPGSYKVQTTADDCRSAFSDNTTLVVTGEISDPFESVKLYPNPVQNDVEISGVKEISESIISDAMGRTFAIELRKDGAVYRGDVHSLANGLYILQIRQGNSWHQIKLVKN